MVSLVIGGQQRRNLKSRCYNIGMPAMSDSGGWTGPNASFVLRLITCFAVAAATANCNTAMAPLSIQGERERLQGGTEVAVGNIEKANTGRFPARFSP